MGASGGIVAEYLPEPFGDSVNRTDFTCPLSSASTHRMPTPFGQPVVRNTVGSAQYTTGVPEVWVPIVGLSIEEFSGRAGTVRVMSTFATLGVVVRAARAVASWAIDPLPLVGGNTVS